MHSRGRLLLLPGMASPSPATLATQRLQLATLPRLTTTRSTRGTATAAPTLLYTVAHLQLRWAVPFVFKFFYQQKHLLYYLRTCRAAMLRSPPGRCAVQGLPRTPRLSLLPPAMALPPPHAVRSWTETATDRVRWSPAASTPQPAPCTLWAAPHSFPTLLKWPPQTRHRITHWPPHRSMGILTHPTACTPPLPLLCILFLTTTLSTRHRSVSPTTLHFLPWLFGSKSNQKPSSLTS